MISHSSRKRHAAETPLPQELAKRTHTKAGGPEKLGSRPLTPTRHPPTSGQAVMRPGGRADNSPAKPPRAPPPLQARRRRRMTRPPDSKIAATDSTPIATPVTGSYRSRTLWAEGRSAALVRPFASWLLPAPTTTSLWSLLPAPLEDCEPALAPSGTEPPLEDGAPAVGPC